MIPLINVKNFLAYQLSGLFSCYCFFSNFET
jgi:hypothetical protein